MAHVPKKLLAPFDENMRRIKSWCVFGEFAFATRSIGDKAGAINRPAAPEGVEKQNAARS